MQCTVVSIAPYEILENKPGIIPPSYYLPPCIDRLKPSVLIVTGAKGAVKLPAQEMTFPYLIPADELANDIVTNLITAQLEYSLDSHPGIFWVEGGHTPEGIVKGFPEKLKIANEKQHNWFKKLVRMADNDWSRSKHSKTISDIQRQAAKLLGLKKEWVDAVDMPMSDLADCKFCGTKILTNVAMCHNCKQIINQDRYNELTKKAG